MKAIGHSTKYAVGKSWRRLTLCIIENAALFLE